MKKITSKVIMLMLIIPMLLVFTMGTTINMTAVMLDNIPVTSVDIEGEEIIFVDVSQENNNVKLNAVVSPKEASNKNVLYTTESVLGEKNAEVYIDDEGVVYPKSSGTVRVIVTADGGRQDSVLINFYSTLATEVEQLVQFKSVRVGETIKINKEIDFNVYPSNANSIITYSTNSNKIKVDKYTGEITGLFAGDAIVTASIEGIMYNSQTDKFEDKMYTIDFMITVEANGEQAIFGFAGGLVETQTSVYLSAKEIPFSYLGYESLGKLSYSIAEEDVVHVERVDLEYSDDNVGKIIIFLKNEAPEKEYLFTIKAGETELGKVTIKKQRPTIRISINKTTYAISNANILFGSIVEGLDGGYTVIYESSDSNVFSVNTRENEGVGKAKSEGTAQVKAILYLNDNQIAVSETVLLTIVNPYISVIISENSKTYGLENRYVLGKYKQVNGNSSIATHTFNIKATDANGVVSNIDYSKVKWSSSDTTVATVDNNGNVNVLKDGVAIISVESVYNDVLETNVKNNFEITFREKGLNVYNYDDLVYANENNFETVLMNNVMLADGINENNYREYLDNVATKQMNATADISYYEDNGKKEDAKIRYCLEITKNVYGNGYYIDANNITRSIDKYNYSIFNGGLNLLVLKYDNNSSGNAKFKSQDNIVFLVKNDNISINNVELKGCSDSSLIESGQTNLAKLNNVGTVLEVVGDNMSLNYSRVNNGKTVIRIYGKAHEKDTSKISANPDNYKIEASISNCILSYGREFILKVGSNQILKNESVLGEQLEVPSSNPSKYDHAAPFFKKENGDNYLTNGSKDEYFINNYLMTDITLKDTVFYGAGLFCVGFETQFAGLALHGYDYGSYKFSESGWKKIAGTSYPARIKMQGDVRFYDWKEVSKVDSSTIVEGDTALLQTIGLDLNVSNLLNKFNEQNPGNKVVYKYEGNNYINGAIIFYGGGKNYSWVETSETNSNFNSLDTFEVPLSYFGDRGDLIYYAAGKENFKFMTYSSEGNLTYTTQKNDLADGSAYSWIIRNK